MTMNVPPSSDGDYLWDRSGEPDALVVELETALAPLRWQPGTAEPSGTRRRVLALLATAAVIALAAFVAQRSRPAAPAWPVQVMAPAGPATPSSLPAGDWFETGADSVRLDVPDAGHLKLEPGSRIRVMPTRAGRRLQLARGSLEAFIAAPPRFFVVDTPSCSAVDLGCMYTLCADEAGTGELVVTLGRVALEGRGAASIVPAGARCRLYATGGGLPVFEDAPDALLDAVDRFDGPAGAPADIRTILDEARPRDALTLWHLLARVDRTWRPSVIKAIARDHALPVGVDTADLVRLDRRALDRWWDDLSAGW